MLTSKEQIEKIDTILGKLKDKDFNVYFMAVDTKGNTSGSVEYIYQLAYKMLKAGYRAQIAYVDINEGEEFVGPLDWLDKKYEEIPVVNVKDENVLFGPEDFVFVPEILSDAILEMKGKVQSKKILVVTDYKRIADFFPAITDMDTLGVHDCITTTRRQKSMIERLFPTMRVSVVSPFIEEKFRPSSDVKGIFVNLLTKHPSDRNRITKEFYWKYPIYRWISFRDLRGLSQDELCEALRSGSLTVWCDDKTEFGFSAIEALKCGNMVLAKTPESPTDWMLQEDGELSKSCLWFNDIDEVSDMIASIVRSWTLDKIPSEISNRYKVVDGLYTSDKQDNEIRESIIDRIIVGREREFTELKRIIESKKED